MSRQGSHYIKDCEKSFKSIERLLHSHKNFINNQRKKLHQNDCLLKKVRQNEYLQNLPKFEDRYRSVHSHVVCKNAEELKGCNGKTLPYNSKIVSRKCKGDDKDTKLKFIRQEKNAPNENRSNDVYLRNNKTQNKIYQHQKALSDKENMYRSCCPKISRRVAGPLVGKNVQKNNAHRGHDNITVQIREREIDSESENYHEGGTSTHLVESSLITKSRNYSMENIYHNSELRSFSDKTNLNVLDRRKRHHHYFANVDFMQIPIARSFTKLNLLTGQVKRNENIMKKTDPSRFLYEQQSKYSGGDMYDWGSAEDEGNSDNTVVYKEPMSSIEIVERNLANRNEQDPKILEIAKLIVNYFQKDPTTFDEKTVRQNSTKYRGRKSLYSLHVTPHAKVENERLKYPEYDYRNNTESELIIINREPQGCFQEKHLLNSNMVITCKDLVEESKPKKIHMTSHAKYYSTPVTNNRLNNRDYDSRNNIESEFTDSEPQACFQNNPFRNSNTVNNTCKDMVGESNTNKFHVTSHAKEHNTPVANERLYNRKFDYRNYSNTVNITSQDMVEAPKPGKNIEAYLDNSKKKSGQSLLHTRATARLREGSVRLENQLPLYDENAHLLGYLKEGTQIIGPSCPQSLDRSLFQNDFNNTQSKHCKFTICNKANILNSENSTKPCVRWTYGSDFTTSVQHELVKAKFRRCPNCERCNS